MKKRDTSKTRRFVIGNWKCTKSIAEARSWIDTFRRGYVPVEDVEVVLAPPNTVLKTSSGKIRRNASREIYEGKLIGKPQQAVWLQL